MSDSENTGFRLRWYHLVGGLLLTFLLTFAVIFFWFRSYFYASPIDPVELSSSEKQELDQKIEKLSTPEWQRSKEKSNQPSTEVSYDNQQGGQVPAFDEKELQPEKYSEDDSKRDIFFTEKELNSLIADNEDLAGAFAVDLAEDLVSVKWVVDVPDDIIVLGGKTLKLNLGAKVAFQNDQPVVELQGVSLGGIPIPNAWLGDLKYKDLVTEFGESGGFWKQFKEGIEELEVVDGAIRIKLKK